MNMQARTASQSLPTQPSLLRSINLDDARPVAPQKAMNNTPSYQCRDCALHNFCLAQSGSEGGLDALNNIKKYHKPLHKGDHFYHRNQVFESVYIVRSGAVKTYYIDEKGGEHITGFYFPGELFGSDGIVEGRHIYNAVALDTSAVCTIPYAALEKCFQSHPDLQRRVIEILCSEIYGRQQTLLTLHQSPAVERLATFLLGISSRMEARGLSATEFVLPMVRRDMAAYLGLTVETLSRKFTLLQSDGLIGVRRRSICISDLDRLKAVSLNMQ